MSLGITACQRMPPNANPHLNTLFLPHFWRTGRSAARFSPSPQLFVSLPPRLSGTFPDPVCSSEVYSVFTRSCMLCSRSLGLVVPLVVASGCSLRLSWALAVMVWPGWPFLEIFCLWCWIASRRMSVVPSVLATTCPLRRTCPLPKALADPPIQLRHHHNARSCFQVLLRCHVSVLPSTFPRKTQNNPALRRHNRYEFQVQEASPCEASAASPSTPNYAHGNTPLATPISTRESGPCLNSLSRTLPDL